MKIRKLFVLLFVLIFALTLVACGDKPAEDGQKADPLVPTGIALKVKTAKVQINTTLKLTYTITPATAQGDAVTVSVNNDLGTVALKGTNGVELTAGSKTGTIKVTVTTSNGIQASKTVKIQEEAVLSYPDLSGYNIKLAQAEHAMGEYDVKLTKETEDKYGYYGGADREAKIQAWDEVEENYNCVITVNPYPSDAPWGPSRWNYILTQAQNEAPEFDFYVVPDAQIAGLVAGNAILDLTDWYAQYGKNLMTDMDITAASHKQRLYGINDQSVNIKIAMCYNLNLYDELHEQDPTIIEPAQMFLDGHWTFDDFKEYCIKVQTALITKHGEGESYYCLAGWGPYYWQGMVNASGVRVLDSTQLRVNITGTTEAAAAQVMQEIYAAGAMDPAFQVDAGVATWNNQHAFMNVGAYWFINTANRWSKDLWGSEEDTRYGFVPFPTIPGLEAEGNYVGCSTDASIMMAAGREWAYKGFGEECTSENIYRAFLDYLTSARKYYQDSEDYNYVGAVTASASERFASEASVQAYLQVILGKQNEEGVYEHGIEEYGFYDPFVGDNPVVSSWGANNTFAGRIASFIKGNDAAQWVDAVGEFQATIEKALVEAYG